MFFQNPAGTTGTDQLVAYSLGSSHALFRQAATPDSDLDGALVFLGNLNEKLTSTYGSDWTGVAETIFAGAAGQNGNTSALSTAVSNGDLARTIYVTKPRLEAGTLGQANSSSPLFDPAETAVAGRISGTNNISGFSTNPFAAETTQGTIIDDNNPFTSGTPSTAYGALLGGIQGGLGSPTSFAGLPNVILTLDLYRVTKTSGNNGASATVWHNSNNVTATFLDDTYPGPNSARADYLGTLTVGKNGDIHFASKDYTVSTPSPTPSPTPGTTPTPSPTPSTTPTPNPTPGTTPSPMPTSTPGPSMPSNALQWDLQNWTRPTWNRSLYSQSINTQVAESAKKSSTKKKKTNSKKKASSKKKKKSNTK